VLVLSGDGSRVLKVKPLVYVSLSLSTWRIGGLLLICSYSHWVYHASTCICRYAPLVFKTRCIIYEPSDLLMF